jgi:hypothetical protein
MNAACGWTLIRKTSLLRKINPMMRRSSFTKKIIYNLRILQVLPNKRHERRNDLEIVNWIPQIALQIQNSDRSPLYDVINPAPRHPVKDERMRSDVFRGRCLAIGCFGDRWISPSSLSRASPGTLRFVSCVAAPRAAEGEAWWSQTGSNRRPHACKARALPAELWPRVLNMRETVSPSSPHSALKTRVNALNGLRRAHFASSPAWLRHA